MKLQLNETGLKTASLSRLFKSFETNIETINHSRAAMFKIVSVIDNRRLLTNKSSYTQKQLKLLASKGIKSPWNETTKTVLVGLYANFSWAQYTKFAVLSQQIDMSIAERVTEDALVLLNKSNCDIAELAPALKKIKGQITRKVISDIVPTAPIKRAAKKVAVTSTESNGALKIKLDARDKEITTLQKALESALNLNDVLNSQVKKLKATIRKG